MTHPTKRGLEARRFITLLASLIVVCVALFYVLTEHRQHALGALPYLLVLLWPLGHLLMHRGHGHATTPEDPDRRPASAGHDSANEPGGEHARHQ